MRDDEDLLSLLNRDPFAGEPAVPEKEEEDLAVDPLGIPILDEVIDPVEPPPSWRAPRRHLPTAAPAVDHAPPAEVELPDYDIALAAIRAHLHSQLEDDIGRLTRGIVPAVVEKVTRDLADEIGAELEQLLEQRLEQLVRETLDAHVPIDDKQ